VWPTRAFIRVFRCPGARETADFSAALRRLLAAALVAVAETMGIAAVLNLAANGVCLYLIEPVQGRRREHVVGVGVLSQRRHRRRGQ
jgi:hypothetical protein